MKHGLNINPVTLMKTGIESILTVMKVSMGQNYFAFARFVFGLAQLPD